MKIFLTLTEKMLTNQKAYSINILTKAFCCCKIELYSISAKQGEIKMKKALFIFTYMLFFIMPTNAASGDVIGKIYSTDILAFANGKPIESYNIGGKTVIIAETLIKSNYGFMGYYNDDNRELIIDLQYSEGYGEREEIERGKTGSIIGDVYETDIKVLFNGIEVKGYNIGGETAVCIEELGDLLDSPNSDFGYSKYHCNFVWNADERTISLNTYIDNTNEITGYNLTYVKYTFVDNVITPEYYIGNFLSGFEPIENGVTFNYSQSFDKYKINPLYLKINNDLHEIGTSFAKDIDVVDLAKCNITDVEKTKELISSVKEPVLSYDDALAYLYSLPGYTVKERLESDRYTMLSLSDGKTNGFLFAAVKKSGGFIYLGDYTNTHYDTISMGLTGSEAVISVYPFADSHGKPTTIHSYCNLDEVPFE
jgi:hypothetical protein